MLSIVFSESNLFAQFGNDDIPARNVPCFQNSLERMGKRYVDWECGQTTGVIDCNERLESDPGSNVVFSRNSRMPFSGTCETCHPNGIKERVVTFVNGRTDGRDTTIYPSGCIQVIREHIEGKEHGLWTYYNDTSGLEAWQIEFYNGEKHGRSIYFNHFPVGSDKLTIKIGNIEHTIRYLIYDSDTNRIEYFNDGKLHGVRKEYYPENKIKKKVSYSNGIMHGPFIVYNREGMVLQELNYNMGRKDGEWKYYYEEGSLLKIENWSNDLKVGPYKIFFINGSVQISENYDRRGRKEGWFEEYFPNERIKKRELYRKGELIEKHVFDEFGREIETVGGEKSSGKEDDDLPSKKKKKWWQFWK